MKKFLVFLIGFAFLGTIVFSQTPENFQKAGKEELAKREKILLEKKAEIERFFDKMADDGVVTGKEMKLLGEMVNKFDKLKNRFNKRLYIYNIETKTNISESIRKILKTYFLGKGINYEDDETEVVRRFFIIKTGRDVIIKKSKNLAARFVYGFFLGFAVAMILFILLYGVAEVDNEVLVFSISGFVFSFVLIIFLFC